MGISDDFYAKNIINHSGETNSFYMTEYYVVKSEAANTVAKILSEHQSELYLNQNDFKKIKSAIIEELNENQGEFIGIDEQLAKAIYIPGSPTIRNPWNNLKSIINISPNKIEEIFHKYNTDLCLLKLSFDNFELDKLPVIEKDKLRKSNGLIKLTHPWQSPNSVDIYHAVPLPTKTDFLLDMLYRRSLTDIKFGLVFNELHHKQGIVYEISIYADYDDNTSEIIFSSCENNSDKITEIIKQTLKNYDQFIVKNIDYIKNRLKIDLKLDWGDIQNVTLWNINRVISGGYIESTASFIKRLDKVLVQDLIKFNSLFLDSLNNQAVSVKRRHGKNVTTQKE